MLTDASYFAFTATPKNKTLEMFGVPVPQADGTVKHRPYHNYSMKQAIQEGFILDVLKYYTQWKSFYKLVKTVTDNPEYDKKKAQKKLRAYVESDQFAIATKANIMVEHFHDSVCRRIDGKARAMVVTSSVERAIEYYYAICTCLEARNSPYKAIIAFSGDREYGGKTLNEENKNFFRRQMRNYLLSLPTSLGKTAQQSKNMTSWNARTPSNGFILLTKSSLTGLWLA